MANSYLKIVKTGYKYARASTESEGRPVFGHIIDSEIFIPIRVVLAPA